MSPIPGARQQGCEYVSLLVASYKIELIPFPDNRDIGSLGMVESVIHYHVYSNIH